MTSVEPRPRLLCIAPNPSIDRLAQVGRLEPGAIHRPTDVVAVAGGKGLNVARAARHLGLPVEVVALLGGHAGRWIAAQLERLEIPHRAAWVSGETRTCISVLDGSTGRLTEFYEPGPAVTAGAWRRFSALADRATAAMPRGSIVAISGSFPPQVARNAAARLVASARAAGARVLLDTSGQQLENALAATPYLVKVSAAEAAAVAGRSVESDAEALAAARLLVAGGAECAIVTRGADGAVGWDGASGWAIGAPPGGLYAVGSGDAFLAGLAGGLLAGETLDRSLRRAAGAAAANTLVAGPGELDPARAAELGAVAPVRRIA